ncbi:hypothetical protein [Pseudomonas typographi]|uniref:Integrase n=1 Tax=Pseudomonas typographi TaxID=2715964 RepID=A0ABR7ZAT7_9PSED|nr:hypothetical protein [Pseudomonas typographi]MBD1602436.1 hypothetical protein [Pseudomonas typographi]
MTKVIKGPYRRFGFWFVDVRRKGSLSHEMFSTEQQAREAIRRWAKEAA